jgi:hypothetical protein
MGLGLGGTAPAGSNAEGVAMKRTSQLSRSKKDVSAELLRFPHSGTSPLLSPALSATKQDGTPSTVCRTLPNNQHNNSQDHVSYSTVLKEHQVKF